MKLQVLLSIAIAPAASANWLSGGLSTHFMGDDADSDEIAHEASRLLTQRQDCGSTTCHMWGTCVGLGDEQEECQCLLQAGVIDNPNLAGSMADQPGVFGCLDVNECANEGGSTNVCAVGSGGYCVDWDPPVKYQCGCLRGYRDRRFDAQFGATECSDINECRDGVDGISGISPCSSDANCANTDGSFDCTCKDGFAGDGIDCFEDAAADADFTDPAPTNVCNANDDCIPKFGIGSVCDTTSGQCNCFPGYFSVNPGFSPCVFRDVCTTSKNPCDTPRATCTPNVDSSNFATCKCISGFESAPGRTEGTTCISSDSCTVPPACGSAADCPARSICDAGQCNCLDGLVCLDLNPGGGNSAAFNCTAPVDLAAVCSQPGASSTCNTMGKPLSTPVPATSLSTPAPVSAPDAEMSPTELPPPAASSEEVTASPVASQTTPAPVVQTPPPTPPPTPFPVAQPTFAPGEVPSLKAPALAPVDNGVPLDGPVAPAFFPSNF